MDIEPLFIKEFSSGQVNNLNPFLAPRNSVALGMNLDFDTEYGSAVSRLGTGIVNAQLENNQPVDGLHNFRDSVGTGHKLFAVVNGTIYDTEAGTSSLSGDTGGLRTRFVTFLDECLRVNGTDAPKAWNGSSWITTGGAFDLGNMPTGNSITIEWLDRVYLAGDSANPDRLYYSSTPDTGAVSWTTGNGYVDIEPEDGAGNITGLGKVPGYILIFKERSLKRWNYDSAFPETLINIGTPLHESIISAGGVCAFYSASSPEAKGFYVTNGGRPVPISHNRAKNIKKWVDAIPASTDVTGWGTDTHFMWSIGDVTVDGVAHTNVVVRWSTKTGEWAVRSYPSEFRVFSGFVSSGANVIVAGDDDGNVIEIDKSDTYTDYPSTPITWRLETQETKFGYNQKKELKERIIWETVGAVGADTQIRLDKKKWKSYGAIEANIHEVKTGESIDANIYQFALTGTQSNGQATIRELEIPQLAVRHNYV